MDKNSIKRLKIEYFSGCKIYFGIYTKQVAPGLKSEANAEVI